MGIIQDWTRGIREDVLEWTLDHWDEFIARFMRGVKVAEGPTMEFFGFIMSLMERAKITMESDLQEDRLEEMSTMSTYPPDLGQVGGLVTHGPIGRGYVEYMAKIQGKFPSVVAAFHELARKRPDFASLRELYNRGFVNDQYVEEILEEEGFQNELYQLLSDPGKAEWDKFSTHVVERKDRSHLIELFKIMPGIGSIITMEVRDAFPKDPREHPPALQDSPDFKAWAAQHGTTPEVYDWEPGGEKSITDALKEETNYGPQSFASWWLGAREQYTITFEKAAKAQGLDPYWAMKFWESHWQLPGFAMVREMLYRVPKMTEEMAAQILRWQDFPPALIDDMVQVAYRPLTRVDVRRMHLRGVLGVARVFQSYLAFGYNAQNAAAMTAFTVLWNMDRLYGDVIKEILKSFAEGALDEETAAVRILEFAAGDVPDTLPPQVAEALTPEQADAVLQTYRDIRTQKIQWILRELRTTKAKANLKRQRAFLDTAQKMFVSWQWDRGRVVQYLAEKGFSSDRVKTLVDDWQPFRDAKERLPSREMLEDFLVEQDMPLEVWRNYMRRLKYNEDTIMAILQGVGRMPTRAMLEDFLTNEIISVDVFKTYMKRLGYDAATVSHLLELLKPSVE